MITFELMVKEIDVVKITCKFLTFQSLEFLWSKICIIKLNNNFKTFFK